MAEAVCIYRSFVEAIEQLDEKDQLAAYKAIVHYGLDGTMPEEGGAAKAILLMAKPVIDSIAKKRTSGAKGGRQKAENMKHGDSTGVASCSTDVANSSTAVANASNAQPNIKIKDKSKNINNNSLSKSLPLRKQIPPSVEMVSEYCKKMGYDFDPQAFIDHYESNGWMVGRTKMKDWEATCRTWAKSPFRNGQKKPKFNFDQRNDYDDAAVEAKLLALQV